MSVKVVFLLTVCFLATVCSSYDNVFQEIYADDGDHGPLSNLCLTCMRETMEHPHERKTCPGRSEAHCGIFAIGYHYWQTAFDRANNEFEEHVKCTLNAWCSKRTVQKYMQRNLPACWETRRKSTNSSVSACETAMILHRFGSSKCSITDELTQSYSIRLMDCLDRRTWNTFQ